MGGDRKKVSKIHCGSGGDPSPKEQGRRPRVELAMFSRPAGEGLSWKVTFEQRTAVVRPGGDGLLAAGAVLQAGCQDTAV